MTGLHTHDHVRVNQQVEALAATRFLEKMAYAYQRMHARQFDAPWTDRRN